MNPSDVPSAAGNSPAKELPSGDDGFELLETPAEAPEPKTETGYWYVAAGASPVGPVSMEAIRQQITSAALAADSLVWQAGLAQWTIVADHPELRKLLPDDTTGKHPLPPPLPGAESPAKFNSFFDVLCNWKPPATAYRLTARCTGLLAALMICVSVALLPFGKSWFSGALLIVLISAVLELAAIMRDFSLSPPLAPSPAEQPQEPTP